MKMNYSMMIRQIDHNSFYVSSMLKKNMLNKLHLR